MKENEPVVLQPKTDRFRRTRRVGRRVVKSAAAAAVGTLALLAPDGTQHTIQPQGITLQSETVFGHSGVTLETPLGDIRIPTHEGPFGQNIRIRNFPVEDTLESLQKKDGFDNLSKDLGSNLIEIKKDIQNDLKKDLLIFALGGSIGWIAGEAMVSQDKSTMKKKGLIFARSALAGVVMSSSLGGLTALTYDSNSIEKATYTDGIAYAKDQIGLLEKFDRHDELIAQTVKNYLLLSKSLEKLDNSSQEPSVCLMTVSDIHSRDVAPLLKAIIKTSCVDAVLDAGDITEWGAAFESGAFAELGNLGVNYYVVKGNHDSPQTMEELIAIPNVTVLDGQVVDIKGLRITGIGDSDYTPDDMISGQGDRPRIDDKIGQRFKAVADSNLPDIAIVHKPQAAKAVQGNARMVISGHSHTCAPRLDVLDSGTLNYNIGTTGGAHLRTFNNKCSSSVSEESGQPQTFSIIYFNVDGKPYAVDEFTLSGLQPNGKLDLQVTRRLVKCENQCAKPG